MVFGTSLKAASHRRQLEDLDATYVGTAQALFMAYQRDDFARCESLLDELRDLQSGIAMHELYTRKRRSSEMKAAQATVILIRNHLWDLMKAQRLEEDDQAALGRHKEPVS